jgi:hypothetical protein
MPTHRYHIHSDIPGKFSLSTKHDARAHASGSREVAVRVKSINELVGLFQGWARTGERVDSLDFHTHGSPGAIYLGRDTLSWASTDLPRLQNTGVQRVFTAKCTITFSGCNVAEEPQGEAFLAVVGKAWLSTSGGSVRGSTGKGLMDPFGWLSPTRVWHPTGRWVTATVLPGGAVTLSGHVWLHPNDLRGVAAKLESLVRPMPGTSTSVPLRPPGAIALAFLDTRHRAVVAEGNMSHLLDVVWKLLGRSRADQPKLSDVATACILLRHMAERVPR